MRTMSDADGEDDGSLALSAIFTVNPDKFLDVPRSVITFPPTPSLVGPQEPPRPPTPEPTIVVYNNNFNNETAEAQDQQNHLAWSTISVRLVGSHPLWGHYLCVPN
jgi:hypothetical protein